MSRFSQRLWNAVAERWLEESARSNAMAASADLVRKVCGFLRDSTPERRRRRYGDMEYDWEHRVNTTSGSVGWRERLLGVFHSPYQPTDAALFREMIGVLPIDYSQFTFVDIGSGKGRTLLMASEYPFRKIVGVEILAELHQAAVENVAAYQSSTQMCTQIVSMWADARDFVPPDGPLVLYLFNPLPPAGFSQLMENLEASLVRKPRTIYLLYHNPLLEDQLRKRAWLEFVQSAHNVAVYRNREKNLS